MTTTEKLIATRINRGGDERTSRELLAEILHNFGTRKPDNLAHALHYQDFARTITAARKAAHVLAKEV